MPDQTPTTWHALDHDFPVTTVGVQLLLDLDAVVMRGGDESLEEDVDPQRVVEQVLSAVLNKSGFNTDTEEDGDVVLADVRAASWHQLPARPLAYTTDELREEAASRNDWGATALAASENSLGDLKEHYRSVIHLGPSPTRSSELLAILFQTAAALGWTDEERG